MAYPTLQSVNNPPFTNLASEIPDTMTEEQVFAIGATELFEVDANGNPTVIPLGQSGPFVLAVDSEAILCSSFSNGKVAVYVDSATDGRGYYGTTIVSHLPGSGDNVLVWSTSVQSVATGGGGGSGTVDSVVPGTGIGVDSTDPANPVVSNSGVLSVVSGTDITIDATDPQNPVANFTGSIGGQVVTVVPGENIAVDSTDPANPIVSGAYAGTSPDNPVWLAPVAWVYEDLTAAGLAIDACTYANGTLGVGATLTQNTPTDGILSIDGGSPSVTDRVLVAFAQGGLYAQSGVYTVTAVGDGISTPWVLTRATDNDTAATLLQYWAVTVTGTGTKFGTGSQGRVGEIAGVTVGSSYIDLMIAHPVGTAIGRLGSTASGPGSTASGPGSTASGLDSTASGPRSTASGNNSTASGPGSTASGPGSIASGIDSTASGFGSIASGVGSIAYGDGQVVDAAFFNGNQHSWVVTAANTADATPTALENENLKSCLIRFVDTAGAPVWNKTVHVKGIVLARDTTTPGTDSCWSFEGVLRGLGIAPTLGATVTAGAPPSLPLTVVTGVNDTFVYTPKSTGTPETFTMAAAVGIASLADLETAVGAATGSASGEAFSTLVTMTDDGTNLIATSVALGANHNGDTLTTGATDVLAGLGFSSPSTFAGGTGGYQWIGGADPTPTVIAQDSAAGAWAVAVTIGTDPLPSAAAAIIGTVTGAAPPNISWVCTLELDEVAG